MAKQYVVTEEEFNSLIDQLKLEKLLSSDSSRFIAADGSPDVARMHKVFHHRVTVWVQAMGADGYRR